MAKSLSTYYNTQKDPTGVVLYVRPIAKEKMDSYVRLITCEVGWMGFIKTYERFDEEHQIKVPSLLVLEDVFLYEQEVSGGSVDAEGVDVNKILQELIDREEADRISELRFFAHSHAGMSSYHSPTDTGMIDDWAATGLDWFISHVQNKKGETDVRMDMFLPFRVSVPVTEIVLINQELQDHVVDEINTKVSKKSYQNHQTGWWNSKDKDKDKHKSKSKRTFSKQEMETGKVVSDDARHQINATHFPESMGTVEKPVIRHQTFIINGDESKQVRQEIVKGVIIHEAIADSPAARARTHFTDSEKWTYWREWKKDNPWYADPTTESLTLVQSSRSVQRSETKRTSDPGQSQQGNSNQTPTQNEVKSDSSKNSNDKEDESSTKLKVNESETEKDKKKKGKPQLTEDEQQESLVVAEDDKKKEDEIGLEEAVEKALVEQGYSQ